MRNIKLKIEYDGKNFAGWQTQPGKISIQGEIIRAIKEVTGEEVELNASGRTDAGVHALGQIANFKTNTNIDIKKIPYALNSKLPNSIVIVSAEEVEERFHSRYNCTGKTYRYIINNSEFPSALDRYREFHISQKLDFNSMKEALGYFEGTHDFKGFKSSGGSPKKTTVRTLTKCEIKIEENRYIIELSGDGFLYNMVRIIAGTIVDVGLGKIKSSDIKSIINSGDRKLAGRTLPPHGLYLVEVRY
ncbi:MAG: tRNA pseudouridine(38-40) synthase TruA [Clostridia bacterium]|nr:tRNA pseudouridine(38-40) synthase TruA [Clostridia bacterium]